MKPHAVLALACAVVAAGCRGGEVQPTAAPAPTSPMATVNLGRYPEHDTRIGSAVPDLSSAWSLYDTTVIPSAHIFDSPPRVPQVVNHTGGVVSDADARMWAAALYRARTVLGWSEAHGQNGLMFQFDAPQVLSSVTGVMGDGGTVSDPPCDLYPVSLTLVALTPGVRAFLAALDQRSQGQYAFVTTTLGTPCRVSGTVGGKTSTLASYTRQTRLIAGVMRYDLVLGDHWYADAAGDCDAPAAPADVCR